MIRIFLPLILAALSLAAAGCSQSAAPRGPAEAAASPGPAPHEAAAMASQSDLAPPSPAAQDPSTPSGAPTPSSQSPSSQSPSSQSPSSQSPSSQTPSIQDAASQSAADTSAKADASLPAERRASTLIGMPVVGSDGSPVGEVKDLIFDRQGRATHVVIAYGTEPATGPAEIPDDGKPAAAPEGKLTAMPWDAALASIKGGRLVLDGAKLQGAPSFAPHAWPNLDDPGWSAAADAYWRKAVRAAIAAHPGNPIDSSTRQRGRPARDNDGDGD